MTTTQHSSFLASPLGYKSPTNEITGGMAALLKDEPRREESSEQVVPERSQARPTASPDARPPASPPPADTKRSSPAEGGSGAAAESMDEKFGKMSEVSVEENGDVIVRVPAELVGRMIGKHGTVIKELQLQSGAFINMAKEGEVHRIARITGTAAETRLCACLLVQKFTPTEQTDKHTMLEELIAHYRKVANRPQKLYVVESFTLPSEALGRVIGKGGATLRELQDRTHAKIDLPRSSGMDEPRKVLTISGLAGEVASCREMLRSLVAEATAQHADYDGTFYPGSPYDSPHMSSRAPAYYPPPGYAVTAPGSPYTVPHYMHSSPAPHYPDSPYGTPPFMMSYPSPPHAAAYYPDQLGAELSRVSLESDDHVVPPEPMPPGAELMLPIPGEMVGRLIGRHGVAVKQMQNESRTRIDVLDPSPHGNPAIRFVRISGPKIEAVQYCVALINNRIAHYYNVAQYGPVPMSPASVHGHPGRDGHAA